MRIDKDGKWWEHCVRCGVEWNIPAEVPLPEEGYLCPGCRSWKRRREPKEEDKNEK